MTKVVCLICGKEFKWITRSHLKTHDIDFVQYKERFPDAKIISEESSQKLSEKARGRIGWNKGLTKETNETVKKCGEKCSKTKKEFFQTEEGQKYIDEYFRGENSPMYGVDSWNHGQTKETNKKLKISGEKQSKTKKVMFSNGELEIWCKGLTKESDKRLEISGEKISKTLKMMYTKGEIEPWCKGETKYTDKRLKISGEKESKTKKEFFQTEEGQKWLDNNLRGENAPMHGKGYLIAGEKNGMYGRIPWSKGLTKETEKGLEQISKLITGNNNPAKRSEVRIKISKSKKIYFTTEEGQKFIREHSGINHPMYGKEGYWKGKVGSFIGRHHSEETKRKMSDKMCKNWQDPVFIKMMVDSWYRTRQTKPEKELEGIVQLLFPKEYKYNGNFELGITIGRKIPDFVNVNGKKKAIEMFGDWCHRDDDPQIRINLFKEYGWDLLVIWEHELKDKDAVKQKILKFHGLESDYVIAQKTIDMWADNNKK